jgi:hypothetical protein
MIIVAAAAASCQFFLTGFSPGPDPRRNHGPGLRAFEEGAIHATLCRCYSDDDGPGWINPAS